MDSDSTGALLVALGIGFRDERGIVQFCDSTDEVEVDFTSAFWDEDSFIYDAPPQIKRRLK